MAAHTAHTYTFDMCISRTHKGELDTIFVTEDYDRIVNSKNNFEPLFPIGVNNVKESLYEIIENFKDAVLVSYGGKFHVSITRDEGEFSPDSSNTIGKIAGCFTSDDSKKSWETLLNGTYPDRKDPVELIFLTIHYSEGIESYDFNMLCMNVTYKTSQWTQTFGFRKPDTHYILEHIGGCYEP